MSLQVIFKRLIEKDALSHAYLLWGYNSSEHQLREALDVVSLFEGEPFIDCLVLRPLDGVVGIQSVREAVRFVWQRPVRARRKILVVSDAEHLTVEAQNAILKTVEEPPVHGLIFFVMRDPSLLVPALQSRFQKIYITGKNLKIEIQHSKQKYISKFLNATGPDRKEVIKNLIEESDVVFNEFIMNLIAELDKNPVKNYHALRELLRRLVVMNQYSTNKRLQLEAVIAYL